MIGRRLARAIPGRADACRAGVGGRRWPASQPVRGLAVHPRRPSPHLPPRPSQSASITYRSPCATPRRLGDLSGARLLPQTGPAARERHPQRAREVPGRRGPRAADRARRRRSAVDKVYGHYPRRRGPGVPVVPRARHRGAARPRCAPAAIAFRDSSGLTDFAVAPLGFLFWIATTARRRIGPSTSPIRTARPRCARSGSPRMTATRRRLLVALGGRQERREVLAPDKVEATVVTLAEGEVFILPARHQLLPGRPIIGASFRVRDLRRCAARSRPAASRPGGAESAERLVVEPSKAHGLWLEFVGRRRSAADGRYLVNQCSHRRVRPCIHGAVCRCLPAATRRASNGGSPVCPAARAVPLDRRSSMWTRPRSRLLPRPRQWWSCFDWVWMPWDAHLPRRSIGHRGWPPAGLFARHRRLAVALQRRERSRDSSTHVVTPCPGRRAAAAVASRSGREPCLSSGVC